MDTIEKEKVSVIMLAQDCGQYLEASVKSVMAQTYQNWELIFVDDASKDNSVQRIMQLRGTDHRFKISQCVFSRGETVNRNSSLRDAHGKWIAFLNAGDIWEPTKLENRSSSWKRTIMLSHIQSSTTLMLKEKMLVC